MKTQEKKAIKQIQKWTDEALNKHNTLQEQKNYIRKKVKTNKGIQTALLEYALQMLSYNQLYFVRICSSNAQLQSIISRKTHHEGTPYTFHFNNK